MDASLETAKKKLIRPRLLVCIPGYQFSGAFLDSWTQLFGTLITRGFKVTLSREYVSTLPVVRHRCLQARGPAGSRQSPFDGQYDYILWIDSDQVFTVDDFDYLWADMQEDEKRMIVSGYYSYSDMKGFAFGWIKDNGDFVHLTVGFKDVIEKALKEETLIEVDWSGMGFMLVRKGVFEAIDYPFFAHAEFKPFDQEALDVMGEDLYWSKKLKDAGISILVDPRCRVGHEKPQIL